MASVHSLPEPTPVAPLTFKAIASYHSNDPGDLPFLAGDIVTVTGIDRNTGWWIGTLDHKVSGLVPMNYVQVGVSRELGGEGGGEEE